MGSDAIQQSMIAAGIRAPASRVRTSAKVTFFDTTVPVSTRTGSLHAYTRPLKIVRSVFRKRQFCGAHADQTDIRSRLVSAGRGSAAVIIAFQEPERSSRLMRAHARLKTDATNLKVNVLGAVLSGRARIGALAREFHTRHGLARMPDRVR